LAVRSWEILWRPGALSASFHGRDLFAPIAGQLALGVLPSELARSGEIGRCADWPDDLAEIVYIDRYGNAMTGLRAAVLADTTCLRVSGHALPRARTFSDVPAGVAFWYENSNGLVEIAVNAGRADAALGLAIGSPFTVSL
jgi:S-adenosylmethionine hydrolase